MKLSNLFAAAIGASLIACPAVAQMDYHGFDPETIDALNERLDTPLSGEALEVLSTHTAIKACGGTSAVQQIKPDGWDARLNSANPPGGDIVMPVPTSDLAPTYPVLYETLGVEGVCEAMFDVTDAGATTNIMTSCSLPGFADATEAMLTGLGFEAAEGQASPATSDILLPVNYCRPDEAPAE